MKTIFSYLKPYLFLVVLIVGLTYVQVSTELALPDYMSDIVSTGIQYGGVKDDVPAAILKSDVETLKDYLNDSEINEILKNYETVEKGTAGVVKNQKIVFNEDIYLLKEDYDSGLNALMEDALVHKYIKENISNFGIKENEIDQYILDNKDNVSSWVKYEVASEYKAAGLSAQTLQTNYILSVGLSMIGIAAVGLIAQIISTYLSTRIANQVGCKLRRDVFEKVESFSSSEFSKFSTASLITRSNNDITQVQRLVQMMLRMMLMAPMMGLTSIGKVLRYPSVAWLLLVVFGVMLVGLTFLLMVAVPKFEIIQKYVDNINSVMREFLDGMMVIRAFGREKEEEAKFKGAIQNLFDVDLFVSRCMAITGPLMGLIMNGLTVSITWFSAKQIDINVMTVGDMMAFIQYAMHIVMSFMMVTMTFFIIPRALVSVRRIREVLDTENTINDKEVTKELPKENGLLEFDNVSFKYPGAEEYVLSNISFDAKPGETVAIIGSTGAGKSTIVKLIPRLFEVTDGSIRYCGIDLRDLKQSDLHSRIGFAAQKATLFSGTIDSNIRFGRDMSIDEINDAVKVSQAEEFISQKEEGLNSPINQGGTNVSGGQKQRISIARSLAKDADIYIFDDTFSALDFETDRKLRAALSEKIKETNATVIIVAQRISTIQSADKIIVLDEGKIVGMGSHQELLRDCEVYKQIASSQLSEKELGYAA